MQTEESKRLMVVEEKIKEAIEIINEQGIGIGMGVSYTKVFDLLTAAHSLIKEVIR